ncbi:MAG: glycosyltransferase family 2 protein [Haloarculaceae archaeon]
MASWTDYLLGPAIVLAVLAISTLSLLWNTVRFGPDLSVLLAILDARVIVLLAAGLFVASFLLYLYYLHSEDPESLVEGGRPVEAIVPVHRDAGVMHRSVEALVNSAYATLQITVVCEPDDAASIERARELSEAHEPVDYLLNHDREGSKAGALNAAIERSDADVIALFDADQEPDPQLLGHAMAALGDQDVARVRSIPRPTGGVLESVVYYEYLALFFLPQKLARGLLGFNFAGTRSILLEASVFEDVGLFSEDTLTEDLDFTHRAHQAGVATRELLYYPTMEEPAHTVRDWWGQRVRWMRGQVAVSGSHLGSWRSLLDRRVLGSVVTSLGTFVAGTLMAMTVPKLALGLISSPLVVGGGLGVIFATLLASRFVDTRTAPVEGIGLAWVLLPVAVSCYGLVILQVVFQHALGRSGDWYSVEKVEG